jgi:protein-disulfide isomerase-like protein with CxxC motif
VITATLYSDPACPWAYSEAPALRVIEWRYGDQLEWRLVLIGLSEDTSRAAAQGYTPTASAIGRLAFRDRYGMPFTSVPKARLAASSRACRAVIAARLLWPGSEWRVFRALQLENFTGPLLLDDDDQLRAALAGVAEIDADLVVAEIESPAVLAAYAADKAQARTAAGTPTELQGKARQTDGPVRYSAPSLVFESRSGLRLEAGGFQPVEAYDVLIANLDPTLHRREPPSDPAPLLEYFRHGLTTQEVAALMAGGNDPPDRNAAKVALLELVGAGAARARQLADDVLWTGDPQS